MFIDVHCHLSQPVFDGRHADVLQRARDKGVRLVVTMGEHYEDNLKVLELADKYDMVAAGLGHHPEYVDSESAQKSLALLESRHQHVCCVGEIGLDHYKVRDAKQRDIQAGICREFLQMAQRYSLPVSVHSRSAGRAALALIGTCNLSVPVNMHAFSGKAGVAADYANNHGVFFSLPGSIFYSRQKYKLLRLLPLSQMLFETDSPVMSPIKGQGNEPANLAMIAREIADKRHMQPGELTQQVWRNSLRYLGLEQADFDHPRP